MIQGRHQQYRVVWAGAGWSYAEPKVQVPCRRWFFFDDWRTVWTGEARGRTEAEKMHPDVMRKWFTDAVEEYETWLAAWRKEAQA